ncbi:MAG: group 1 glycosyl transferase [Candidatus Nitrosocaldaceae archaeon]|nr:MAG: group 1 glycosyl transferase [Candidatus Nitrosocaldaceae archaeon]
MKVVFITDPLVTTFGAVKPALLLAREFIAHGHDTTIISPTINDSIKTELTNIETIELGMKFRIVPNLPTFEAWLRSLFKEKDYLTEEGYIINTSSCVIAEANVYYAQGLMTEALNAIISSMPMHYRVMYSLSSCILHYLERKMVTKFRLLSKLLIANSNFCSSMYSNFGIDIDDIIYPPLDCELFKPKKDIESDYILTYIGIYGKETKFSVLNKIANNGVKIKGFGAKTPFIPSYILNNPNIELVGKVSTEELVDLYSNALYTLFPFTHEPFGYIPIESMACSTPVLTYNKQGPAESVIHNKTGWLVNNDEQMIRLALKIWKDGYSNSMRIECRKRALEFDVKKIFNEWLEILI